MTQVNRTTLKSYFLTGNKPTEDQFGDLIDSSLNFDEDKFTIGDGKIAVGSDDLGQATLWVKGKLTVSGSDINPPDEGIYVGGQVHIGNSFSGTNADLGIDGGVYIGSTLGTDPGIHNLQLDGYVKTEEVRAKDGSGLKLYEDGGALGLLINDTGNVDIGGSADTERLRVTGTFRATGNSNIDGNLTLASSKYVEADQIQATSGSSLALQDNSGNGISIAAGGNVDIGGTANTEKLRVTGTFRATGNSNIDGNLTLASSKHIATDEIRALGTSGLKLYEDGGSSGILINNGGNVDIGGTANTEKLRVTGTFRATGNSNIDGNLTLASSKHVATDEIRALGTSGLKLYEDGGSSGILINNGGNVDIGGTANTEKLRVTGTFRATGNSNIDGNLTLASSKRVNANELRSVTGAASLHNSNGTGLNVNTDGELQFGVHGAMVSHEGEALGVEAGSGSNTWQVTNYDTGLASSDYHIVVTGWKFQHHNSFSYNHNEPILRVVDSGGNWIIEPVVSLTQFMVGSPTLSATVDFVAIRKEFFISGVHTGTVTQLL